MNRIAVTLLLWAVPAFAADAEVPLEVNDKVLIATVCTRASIPGPLQFGHTELGALRETKPGKYSPRYFGWVSINTDEKSLRSTPEQYAKELAEAMRRQPLDRYPAPCVGNSAMESVLITAVIRTERGYVGIASYGPEVRTLAPEADEKKAQLATVKLAGELASVQQLAPALVKNLHGKAILSGRLSRDWSQTP